MSILIASASVDIRLIVERIQSFQHFYTLESQGNLGGFE
jgi:hypothetical protein